MGAAPLLIMLAAVGVDYGWQPDGTTSPRGDNVEYIIQIPPAQLDQIKSIGEITSAIDPEIQGRISKVVVRVGTAKLPRDAGRAASVAAVSQAAALDDDAQIPIPEISDTAIAQAPTARAQTDRADSPGSEALMKPDPQAGGFALPDSLANPVRTNPAVSTEPAANRDNQWNDIRSQSPAGGTGTNAATAGTSARGPSTDPVDPAARSTAWPTTTGQSGVTGTADSAGLGTATAAPNVTSNPANAPTATSGTRRATDPSDPNWSGYGTTPNFGTLPPGLNTNQSGAGSNAAAIGYPQTMPTAADLSRQASDLQRNVAGQIDSAAAAAQTFARDAAGNLLDRLGRPIDSLGRLIDPESGNLVDASGNWIDQHGRKIDRFGRLLPSESTTAAQGAVQGAVQGNVASLQAPPLASQRNDAGFYNQPAPGYLQIGQTAAMQQGQGPLLNQQYANQQYANQQHGYGATSNATDSRLLRQNDHNHARAPIGFEEDNLRSASDTRLALNSRAAIDTRAAELELARQAAITRQAATAPTKPRGVAAQPFFNFMLLISVVGNAYLIFETSNLRRKFRNMIANVRATKISAQPAS